MGIELKPHRRLTKIQKEGGEYHLTVNNSFTEKVESLVADVVILSTGFRNLIPAILEPLLPQIPLDPSGRFMMNRDFTVQWAGAEKNKIFAFNFSRHGHGISEPQTSLMAWRSGVVLNSLLGEEFYRQKQIVPNFVNYGMDPL
jgi:lysine N6-hydroxylase